MLLWNPLGGLGAILFTNLNFNTLACDDDCGVLGISMRGWAVGVIAWRVEPSFCSVLKVDLSRIFCLKLN